MADEEKGMKGQEGARDEAGSKGQAVGEKTFSQADVDALIAQRLERFSSKVSREKAEGQLKIDEANKSIQELSSRLEEAQRQVEAYELQEKKAQAVKAAGLPAFLASRISGQTDDELRADAEALAKEVRGYFGHASSPLLFSQESGGSDVDGALREAANTLFGNS